MKQLKAINSFLEIGKIKGVSRFISKTEYLTKNAKIYNSPSIENIFIETFVKNRNLSLLVAYIVRLMTQNTSVLTLTNENIEFVSKRTKK